ncbi:hypothetical protein PIB30_035621 [Stylosanthes scabra]|uniref:Uncharacterized protein n=1 Tax=Stylosanthes scabra TaxID=79078 RepID=A0ABU6YAF6_9FABA|nr:hypothetical protein [Stylosanthes scabra]
MSDSTPKKRQLPYLGDDIIRLIFVRTHQKTVGRCHLLSTRWKFLLRSDLFVIENFKQNIVNLRTVVVGVGPPPNDDVSRWFIQANVHNGRQYLFRVPAEINHFGSYAFVGSDKGIVCKRFSIAGHMSKLLIWNPLKNNHQYATDEASKYEYCSMNNYAFGFLKGSTDQPSALIPLVGPPWGAKPSGSPFGEEPSEGTQDKKTPHLTQNLKCPLTLEPQHRPCPIYKYHYLIHFNGGVGFMGHRTVGFMQTVMVRKYTIVEEYHLSWDKVLVVGGMEIPYSPSFFVGKDPVSVIEMRQNGKGNSNDDDRTDLVISKLKFLPRKREHLTHHSWPDHIHLKTVTLHIPSLFDV